MMVMNILQTRKCKKLSIHHSRLSYVLSLILFIIPFWGLSYTSDWVAYNYYFDHPEESRDIVFGYLSSCFRDNGFSYEDLFKFHIILIGLLYQTIFWKLKSKPLFPTLCLIIFMYVQIGNQIRFYSALPLAILSFLYYTRKKHFFSTFLIVISVLFHTSAVLFYISILIFYNYIIINKFSHQFIYLLLSNFGIWCLIGLTGLFNPKYLYYLGEPSSIVGGIFNGFSSLVSISLIFIFTKSNPNILRLQIYKILYTLCISTSIFFMAGCQIQILTNRFISSMLPFWVIYLMSITQWNNLSSKIKAKAKSISVFLIVFLLFWKFVLSVELGVDSYLIEVFLMLDSYKI